jgi:hypothetical protein
MSPIGKNNTTEQKHANLLRPREGECEDGKPYGMLGPHGCRLKSDAVVSAWHGLELVLLYPVFPKYSFLSNAFTPSPGCR